VIEHGRERIRAAAIALVIADHVHPRGEGFVGDAQHILRFARAFEAVKQNKRSMRLAILLPMALSANLCSLFKFEEAPIAFGQPWVLTAPERSCDGH